METSNDDSMTAEELIRILEERQLKIPNLQEFTKAELLSVYDKIKPLPQRKQYNHHPIHPVPCLALSTDDEMEGIAQDDTFTCQSKDTIESLDFQKIRINSPKLNDVSMWGSQLLAMGNKRCFGVLNSELDYVPSKKYKHS